VDRLIQFFRDPWKAATTALGIGLLVTTTVLLAGSGSASPTTTTTPGGTTTTTESGPGTTRPSGSVTGFKGALAVKVDNAQPARPQVGIGMVPVLIEYPVEGGLTRFVAVIDEHATGRIGPVRSLRPVDADLFPLLAPSVVSTGGQSFVIREVEAGRTLRVEPGILDVFTFAERPAPYNVFLEVDQALSRIETFNPSDPPFPAGQLPPGAELDRVSLPAWGVEFVWENGAWARYQFDVPFLVSEDVGTEPVPLDHDVVLILEVGQRSAGYTDSNGAEVYTFDVIGAGHLTVLHQGQMTAGSWLRRNHAEGFSLTGPSGEKIGLPEGRVYVAFVPLGSAIETEEPSDR
jgi:hypothetical protein